MHPWRLIVSLLLLCGLPPGAWAADGLHTFWEVKGQHNTVYLLGSVHMLKPADSALPAEALQAYAESKVLVMELELNDLGADDLLGSSAQLATLPEGQSLPGVLGPELNAQLDSRLEAEGLDPQILSHSQPWFAALMLEQLELAKSGFEPGAGVDEQFAQRAQADHKPIIGLETIDQQLGIFAQLSLEQQRQYLRTTLQQSTTDASETQEIVHAWQHGDTAELERMMRRDSSESPELYRLLTSERNRKWLPRIIELLHADDDCLVIVGALHLVGRDGIVDLLRQQGYAPVQR